MFQLQLVTDAREPDCVRRVLFRKRVPRVSVHVEHSESIGPRSHVSYPIELGQLVSLKILDHNDEIIRILYPACQEEIGYVQNMLPIRYESFRAIIHFIHTLVESARLGLTLRLSPVYAWLLLCLF